MAAALRYVAAALRYVAAAHRYVAAALKYVAAAHRYVAAAPSQKSTELVDFEVINSKTDQCSIITRRGTTTTDHGF